MSRVRILTDSTSDIPSELAERLKITVVPAYVQMGSLSYRDEPTSTGFSREEFYRQLSSMPDVPTTAVPPAHEFAAAYRDLANEAEELVVIVVSTTLSGMYNVAHLAAQDVPDVQIHIVDSEQVTMGLGWLVIAAAEAAAEGKGAREILALIEDMKPRVHVYAMLDTLEYLRRSGRVRWARARAAQILRIKPIVEVFLGKVIDIGRVRTRQRAIDHLLDCVRALGPLERLAILHTYSPDLETFGRRLADLSKTAQLTTVAVTTIIGAHVGPKGLGVATVTAH
jgi:DegV family protein with EDD domain